LAKITKDYPIYIDPSFEEICELATSNWDTCRILTCDDLDDVLIIGSGYGNTHQSLVVAGKAYFNVKRFYTSNDKILFHKNEIAFISEAGEEDRFRYERWKQDFTSRVVQQLKDLIRESGYSL
jgi:hypothetical protein